MKISKALFLSVMVLLVANLGFTQSSAISPFDTTIYGRNEKVGRVVNTRGFNMYYETYGTGKPLLMIHGNGGSMNNFLYQIPCFSKSYTVILADSRAQGRSVDPGDSLSYEMMADDLNALLDSLHLDSCYVIGWSDGGINGLLLAIRHPEKVKKLAITGANLWPDSTEVGANLFTEAMKYYNSLTKMAQTPKVKNDRKLAYIISFEPHISIGQLNKIRCPSLVIGGDHDVILPRHTMFIAESIPGSFLWILPDSGHDTLISYKDIFNQVVSGFFSKP